MIDRRLEPAVSDPDDVESKLAQHDGDEMQFWPVAKRVGNVRNDSLDLADKVPEGTP